MKTYDYKSKLSKQFMSIGKKFHLLITLCISLTAIFIIIRYFETVIQKRTEKDLLNRIQLHKTVHTINNNDFWQSEDQGKEENDLLYKEKAR